MKNLKLSFALIIAVLAVGITVATKANFGKRVISRCFYDVQLTNVGATLTGDIDAFQTPRQSCDAAKSIVASTPLLTGASVALSLTSEDDCIPGNRFCCVKVTEMLPTEAGYADAAFLNLGEGSKKYKVASQADVICKNN